MTIIQAIILGVVQGVTELLPISSSAHLNLIPWFFNWYSNTAFEEAFNAYDIALHFGTLLSIAIFFFRDWIKLFIGGYNQVINKKKTLQGKMFWYLVIATIPGAGLGFIADHFLEDYLKKAYLLMAIALITMGIVLYIVDKKCKSNTDFEHMSFKQAFIIGFSQCLAFIPGVSRSGITMTTGRIMGIDRESTAKYSFLLATPIVFGATIYKLISGAFAFNLSFFVGVITSFIIGLIVIKFLLEYLKKGDFKFFALYRILIGIIVIIVYMKK